MAQSTWLFSRQIDLIGLYLPIWFTWLLCFWVPDSMMTSNLPLWAWVIFVLGADMSHVWSTIFRTYLDKNEFQNHKKILLLAPIICIIILFPFAFFGEMIFWRVMAYLALYHFLKQQYGFLMLYRAKSKNFHKKYISDKFIIYFSMLYPVVIWHFSDGLEFDWFIKGDFLELYYFIDNQFFKSKIIPIGNAIYWLLMLLWVLEDVWICRKENIEISYGKILWTLSTAMNWFLGIIWLNSDFAFSVTNVVAHGIPYMILVFFYVERKKIMTQKSNQNPAKIQIVIHICLMVFVVVLLAFGEGFFWDMLLNDEKNTFFESIISYPMTVLENPIFRAVALVMLSVPQVSHYIIDGFIWKNNDKNPYLKPVLFKK